MEVNVCELIAIYLNVKVEVKFTLEQATKSQRGVDVYLYSFCNPGSRCRGWATPIAGGFAPGNNSVTLVKGVGRGPRLFWTGPRFNPRNIQSVESHYTN